MRLKSIKLAGFKSFVDPTNFDLPGQLIGVVGPNGCGKSNIIDAVRWVLGESRASELRGESMQDVIFNGSSLRKPSGRASVELVFDNTEGRAQGQWSAFAELSVKRVLTRDGASNYFINQQSVRRKDIQDMFLGTGLGPKAYAIIGQGMISRIIEAKPEELRIFLEEAAGVSKYKERRKETESRLEDTQENLTRVRDILRELDNQLLKLESQAEVAKTYQQYQSEVTDKQHMLWLMRLTEGEKEQQSQQELIRSQQVKLEEQLANLRAIETNLELKRTTQFQAQDLVTQSQGRLYEINATISQIESEIRFSEESKNRFQQQLQDIQQQLLRWQTQRDLARDQLKNIETDFVQAKSSEEDLQQLFNDHESELPEMDGLWQTSQNRLDVARTTLNNTEKDITRYASMYQSLCTQLEQAEQRISRLSIDIEQLIKPDAQAMQTALDRHQSALKKRDEAQQKQTASQESVPVADKARHIAQENVQRFNQSLNQTQAKLNALKTLQDQVQAQGKLRPWLEKNNLHQLPRLWQKIQVESGWEQAVEAVLRERIGAIESARLQDTSQYIEQVPPSRVAWFETNATNTSTKPNHAANLTPLMSRIQVRDLGLQPVVEEWLGQVFVVDSVSDGIARRNELPFGAIFVAKSGHVVSRVGIQLYAADNEQAGLIARAKEIESLEKQLKSDSLILEEAQGELAHAQSQYQQAHQQAQADLMAAEQAVKDAHRFEVEAMQLRQAEEQYSVRASQIQREITETTELVTQLKKSIQDNQHLTETTKTTQQEHLVEFESAVSSHQDFQKKREETIAKRQDLMSQLQESSFIVRTLTQRQTDLGRDISTAEEQISQLEINKTSTEQELEKVSTSDTADRLQIQLDHRSNTETELAEYRTKFDALMFDLKQTDEQRLITEKAVEPVRQSITNAQLKEQAARLTVEQYQTLLEEHSADIEGVRAQISQDTKASNLQQQVNELTQKISALGPVNMAALGELSSSRERKGFLDAQSADLNEAIQTLTDAIMKIDGETRELLQGTFDLVNQHFSQIFPALFGGGNARLVMTGEEILDAGVQVMAQPPGKKNTTIHLLSGGEKALTAIALVFSMFQLNPAPFCLLDEVDAPLDDANTGRYTEIVAKMSQKTQFLFISHNKITMEIANQLIGVTMQEQGVSRVVAVDLQVAAALTQTH